MTFKQALSALKKAGTAQNRKIYGNHGVTIDMYGVSFAELKKLKKQIGTDTELARQLWDAGNHDARILACMIAGSNDLASRELDSWARELDSYVVTDAFATLVSRTPHARKKFSTWRDRKSEWVSTTAWNIMSHLALDPDIDLSDTYCSEQIALIEREIHTQPNRTRHSMNQALIALGVRNDQLQKKAMAAAAKIGRVEVDHGTTSCKTPDAAAYILKTVAYQKSKGRR